MADFTDLRRKAEDLLDKHTKEEPLSLSEDEIRELIHELTVHQAELEIQNVELRNAQEELTRSRDQFADLYNLSPIGFVTLDNNGIIKQQNRTFLKMIKHEGSLVGKPFTNCLDVDDARLFNSRFRSLLSQPEGKSIDLRFVRKDNSIFWGRLSARLVDSLKILADNLKGHVLSISITDVNDEKAAQDAMLNYHELLKSIERIANIGAWRYDPANQIFTMSEEACSIYGFDPHSQPSLATLLEVFCEEDRSVIEAAIKNAAEHEKSFELEVRLQESSTSHKWVRLIGMIELEHFDAVCVTGTVQDIDIQKKMFDLLTVKNDALERMNFMASHDLKSPLVTIGGYASMLKEGLAKEDSESARYLDTILKSVGILRDKLNALTAYSRMGRIEEPKERLAVAELVKEAVESLHGLLAEPNIPVKVQHNMPDVFGSRNLLISLFQNLIENAIKYGGDKSSLLIEVGCQDADGEAIFFVQDNGPGIPEEYSLKAFDLFEQFNEKPQGSGLGLAMVKRIVEYHGGKIWIDNKPAKTGALFYFTLPVISG